MQIEKRKISDLKYAEYNPRKRLKNGDPEYIKLRNSIEKFGYVEPVIVNERTGNIVGGHQRITVLKDIGEKEADCVIVNLDEQDEKALNIALNKISGEWDSVKLEEVLRDLKLNEYDVELTGFDLAEIDGLLGLQQELEAEEDDFDVEAEKPKEAVSKYGQIYKLGRHRLMCGDSTKEEDVARLMSGEKVGMVFTDPPWNVNYGDVEEGNAQGYKPRKIMNDFMGTLEFKEFMYNAFSCMSNVCLKGCMVYVVMSAQEWGNMMLSLLENGFHWSSTIIWNKDRLVMSRKDYHTKYEPIWYGWKDGERRICPLEDRKQSDVWDITRPSKSEDHPTMKPVELVSRAIKNSSKEESDVLDLFGGSGTTLIACEQLNRTCYMMELDPIYVDVIIKRWEKLTGEKAELIEG